MILKSRTLPFHDAKKIFFVWGLFLLLGCMSTHAPFETLNLSQVPSVLIVLEFSTEEIEEAGQRGKDVWYTSVFIALSSTKRLPQEWP